MENEELLEQTNETENVDTQTTEEFEEGIELTDTADIAENTAENAEKEIKEVSKTLKELLRENPSLQEEFNGMMKTRLDRKDREYQKELSKYKDTDNVLRSTLNVQDGEDVNLKLREAYEAEGYKLPEAIKPGLSSREIEVLAKDEANQIIEEGYDAMVEEANKLASIGYANLNERQKVVFMTLGDKISEENNRTALLKLGAKEELLKDESFVKFRKQFNSDVPIETIYSLYKGNQPKKEVDNPGSMRNSKVNSKKSVFTDEDIAKMTDEELEANWDAIRKYQTSGNH